MTFPFVLSRCAATFRHTKAPKPINRRNIFHPIVYDTCHVFSSMTDNLIRSVRINSTCRNYMKHRHCAAQYVCAQLQLRYWLHLADSNTNKFLTAFCHAQPNMTEELPWWQLRTVSKAHRHQLRTVSKAHRHQLRTVSKADRHNFIHFVNKCTKQATN
jgi:hypothetical protein